MPLRADARPYVPSKSLLFTGSKTPELGDQLIQNLADQMMQPTRHPKTEHTDVPRQCGHMPASGLFCPDCVLMKPCPFHKPSDCGVWPRPSLSVERVRIIARKDVDGTDNALPKLYRATKALPPAPTGLPPPPPPLASRHEGMHSCSHSEQKRYNSVAEAWLEKATTKSDDSSTDICASELQGNESEESDDVSIVESPQCSKAPVAHNLKPTVWPQLPCKSPTPQLPYKSAVWACRPR